MEAMMRSRTAATLAVAAMALALTSCSAAEPDDRSEESDATASASEKSPPPEATGPCGDGTCEIEVEVGDEIVVPDDYGLGPIEVTDIADDEVTMVAPLTGTGYSVNGCSGGGGTTSNGGGGVEMRCGEGPAATVNDAMSLKVVEIKDATAVLRIEPAG